MVCAHRTKILKESIFFNPGPGAQGNPQGFWKGALAKGDLVNGGSSIQWGFVHGMDETSDKKINPLTKQKINRKLEFWIDCIFRQWIDFFVPSMARAFSVNA